MCSYCGRSLCDHVPGGGGMTDFEFMRKLEIRDSGPTEGQERLYANLHNQAEDEARETLETQKRVEE